MLILEPWRLNLRHLRAFAMIVRMGSAAAAARELHVSQPAITQGLATLESTLGRPLFVRRSDGMSPTARAAQFAIRVEEALRGIGSPRITSTQARAFLALARTGDFHSAGAMIGVSAPSVHRAVKGLEYISAAALATRRAHGMELTDKGRRLARRLSLAGAALRAGIEELATP